MYLILIILTILAIAILLVLFYAFYQCIHNCRQKNSDQVIVIEKSYGDIQFVNKNNKIYSSSQQHFGSWNNVRNSSKDDSCQEGLK